MGRPGYSRAAQLYPHGGHMIALHIVVGLGLGGSEAYPGVFAPVGGYATECTVAGRRHRARIARRLRPRIEGRPGAAHRQAGRRLNRRAARQIT